MIVFQKKIEKRRHKDPVYKLLYRNDRANLKAIKDPAPLEGEDSTDWLAKYSPIVNPAYLAWFAQLDTDQQAQLGGE